MKYRQLHPWKVSPKKAFEIQTELAKRIILKNDFGKIKRIAGVDSSYNLTKKRTYAGVIIYSFPELEVLESSYAARTIEFPYIPGLLTFREGPAVMAAFKKIKKSPDIAIFDGQGIAHPRRMGLATHIGILLGLASIGCAKSHLVGTYSEPPNKSGGYSWLKYRGKTVGAAVRTRKGVKPVFISAGFKVDLTTSIELILNCRKGYRLPEPTREAHIFIGKVKRYHLSSSKL